MINGNKKLEVGEMSPDLIIEGMDQLLKHCQDPKWIARFTEEKQKAKEDLKSKEP